LALNNLQQLPITITIDVNSSHHKNDICEKNPEEGKKKVEKEESQAQ